MSRDLVCEGLVVEAGARRLLDGASLRVPAAAMTALVGRSGAGKSTLARALVGLVRAEPGVTAGRVVIEGSSPIEWAPGRPTRLLHGAGLAWSSQHPWGGLSPFDRVGTALRRAGARDVGAVLGRVGLPGSVASTHPHTLSGGMARRAGLAVALAGAPRFLVADEPTAGLDPTIADAVLAVLRDIAAEGVGVLVLGHDLLALRRHADRLALLHAGAVAEVVRADAPFTSAEGRALAAAAEGPPWS